MKQHNTRKSYLNRDARATASVTTTPDSTLPSYSISVGGLTLTNCTSSGIVSSREYDALGRVAASTDGRGNTTTLSYDAQGRVSWSEDALGARTTYAYDALGRQIAVTNALGQAVSNLGFQESVYMGLRSHRTVGKAAPAPAQPAAAASA